MTAGNLYVPSEHLQPGPKSHCYFWTLKFGASFRGAKEEILGRYVEAVLHLCSKALGYEFTFDFCNYLSIYGLFCNKNYYFETGLCFIFVSYRLGTGWLCSYLMVLMGLGELLLVIQTTSPLHFALEVPLEPLAIYHNLAYSSSVR